MMVGLSTDGGFFTILTSTPFEFFSNPIFFIIHFGQTYPHLKFPQTTPRLILPEWVKDATFGCHPSLMFQKANEIDQVLHTASLQTEYDQSQFIKKYLFPDV